VPWTAITESLYYYYYSEINPTTQNCDSFQNHNITG